MAKRRLLTKELRTLPEPDLQAQLAKLRQELWQHRAKVREGSLQQTHLVTAAKRNIARIQTVLSAMRRPTTSS